MATSSNTIQISNETYDIVFVERAINWYNKRRLYESELAKKNRPKRNEYQKEYMDKIKEDKSCPQYQQRLANQRKYYNEVIKIKKKQEKEEQEEDKNK